MDTANEVITLSTNGSATLDPAEVAALTAVLATMWIVLAVLVVISVISMWKLFTKAGKPGWAAIVPIYNNIVVLEIVGRPIWWIFLYFVPIANVVAQVIVTLDVARAYGRDLTFGVLMLFFPVPMYPILAFSKQTEYKGPVALNTYNNVAPTNPEPSVAETPKGTGKS